MNSKTAKALDKAFLRLEKEFERAKAAFLDAKAEVQKHYTAKPKAKKDRADV